MSLYINFYFIIYTGLLLIILFCVRKTLKTIEQFINLEYKELKIVLDQLNNINNKIETISIRLQSFYTKEWFLRKKEDKDVSINT